MLFSGQAGAVRRIQIARERLRKLAVLGGVMWTTSASAWWRRTGSAC
jgi:hypothetical protein